MVAGSAASGRMRSTTRLYALGSTEVDKQPLPYTDNVSLWHLE
jgi:hypothetical protein